MPECPISTEYERLFQKTVSHIYMGFRDVCQHGSTHSTHWLLCFVYSFFWAAQVLPYICTYRYIYMKIYMHPCMTGCFLYLMNTWRAGSSLPWGQSWWWELRLKENSRTEQDAGCHPWSCSPIGDHGVCRAGPCQLCGNLSSTWHFLSILLIS